MYLFVNIVIVSFTVLMVNWSKGTCSIEMYYLCSRYVCVRIVLLYLQVYNSIFKGNAWKTRLLLLFVYNGGFFRMTIMEFIWSFLLCVVLCCTWYVKIATGDSKVMRRGVLRCIGQISIQIHTEQWVAVAGRNLQHRNATFTWICATLGNLILLLHSIGTWVNRLFFLP